MQPAFFILVIKTTPRKDKTKEYLLETRKPEKIIYLNPPTLLFLLSDTDMSPLFEFVMDAILAKKKEFISIARMI